MIIDKEVENVLRESGWDERRRLDKEAILDQLSTEGYPVLENVVEALQNFNGLVIYFNNKRNGLRDDINFDFSHAIHLEVPERVFKNYVPRIGKKLILIGSAYRDHFVLLMAEDNSIYGGYDNYLCKIGSNPINAIENIILDKNFTEIPPLPQPS